MGTTILIYNLPASSTQVLKYSSNTHSAQLNPTSHLQMPSAINIIFSPYHVGLRDHRVGNGPHRLQTLGLTHELQTLGAKVILTEIDAVDTYEGEIGRSFELLRRISIAVTHAIQAGYFPLILSGNCMASVGAACGLGIPDRELGFIYFDAHDDLDSPATNENGYFDAMGLSMLRGESWDALMRTVPGFDARPFAYSRFLYCGLRDQTEVQRRRVVEAGMETIWGDVERKVDFPARLKECLEERQYSPALVHLDLDVLDESYGKVNSYPSPGGMFEDQLVKCMDMVPKKATPRSLTVCSFDPDAGDGDRIAGIGIRAIKAFVQSLMDTDVLSKA